MSGVMTGRMARAVSAAADLIERGDHHEVPAAMFAAMRGQTRLDDEPIDPATDVLYELQQHLAVDSLIEWGCTQTRAQLVEALRGLVRFRGRPQ